MPRMKKKSTQELRELDKKYNLIYVSLHMHIKEKNELIGMFRINRNCFNDLSLDFKLKVKEALFQYIISTGTGCSNLGEPEKTEGTNDKEIILFFEDTPIGEVFVSAKTMPLIE